MTNLESLLADITALDEETLRTKARAVVRGVLEMHRDGLARILEITHAGAGARATLVEAFVEDAAVSNLMLLHDLHPLGLEERVRRAFAAHGASLRARWAMAEFVSLSDGVVHVRVRLGSASRDSIQTAIEELVDGSAPDAAGLVIAWEPDPQAEAGVHLTQLRVKSSKPRVADAEGDGCELCGHAISARHEHLIHADGRDLRCTCTACAVLFGEPTAESRSGDTRKWKRVPYRAESLSDFRLTDAQWEATAIPVGTAFFRVHGASREVLALYPGPAGAIESRLPPEAWAGIAADNPVLGDLAPDVEALLVNRLHGARDYYRVSIDRCYELVGRLRKHWRGFTGGADAWSDIGQFFVALTRDSGGLGA